MIHNKCKNCSALVVPYFSIWNKPNPKLPDQDKEGTCKCNVDSLNRNGEGYYGWCHPDECMGPEHKYYFDHTQTGHPQIKFIND